MGYVKGDDGIAAPDPVRAPFVRQLFEMYATGQHTDHTLTAWLNVNEQRTARDRAFGVDTVREMLCNAAYAGYVSGRRDKTKAIKGLHQPVVDEVLFDRVQLIRRQRARTMNPGRPSPNYLLRGLARCRRCNARMQGTTGGRANTPRYYCASRRANHSCDQPIIPAEQVEQQLAAFLTGFAPNPAIRKEILTRLSTNTPESSDATARRDALEQRLTRARDLYGLGDLDRPEYIARRDAIHAELDALAPEPTANLDQASKVLADFRGLLVHRDRPHRQAPTPQPHLRRRMARPRPLGGSPAQALVPGVLPATAPRNGGGK